MPKTCYTPKRFGAAAKELIDHAERIMQEYARQDFVLTLRQLYYQFVSRDLLTNNLKSYKRLGELISDARLAGLLDWDALEDRTRGLKGRVHWDSPAQVVATYAEYYNVDLWADQPYYVELWVEKEALAGVFSVVCSQLDVPYLSCKGYTSQSEMWAGAQRFRTRCGRKRRGIILHFGDHDPSGIDMSRDITDRMATFGATVDVRRVALNMDQVEEYAPPPNPAKTTDARFAGYVELHGEESWELDALDPVTLSQLVRDQVDPLVNRAAWARAEARQEHGRQQLRRIAENWNAVMTHLD